MSDKLTLYSGKQSRGKMKREKRRQECFDRKGNRDELSVHHSSIYMFIKFSKQLRRYRSLIYVINMTNSTPIIILLQKKSTAF